MRAWSVSLVLCAALLSACSNTLGSTEPGEFVVGDGAIVEFPPDQRLDPVRVTGESLDGDPLDSRNSLGHVLVVNLWASNCGPCISEMPLLAQAETEAGDGVDFLGINLRDQVAAAQGLVDDTGVDYPSIFDPSGQTLLQFPGRLSPRSIPTTMVLDADGRVAAIITGEVPTLRTLQSVIDQAAH